MSRESLEDQRAWAGGTLRAKRRGGGSGAGGGGGGGVVLLGIQESNNTISEVTPAELMPLRCPPPHLGMWSTAHCCSAHPAPRCSCPAGSSLAGSLHGGW